MALLVLVVVLYLGVVAVLAATTGLSTATRTGFAVARVGAVLVVVLDLVSLRHHRPAELATHLAYAGCAVVLPWLLTARAVVQAEPSRWVVAGASVATAVVLVRLAQTWS